MNVSRVHFSQTVADSFSSEGDTEKYSSAVGSLISVHKRNSDKFPNSMVVGSVLELIEDISSHVPVIQKKIAVHGLLKKLAIDDSVSSNIQVVLDRYTIKFDRLGVGTKAPFYSERILKRNEMEGISSIIGGLLKGKLKDCWCYLSEDKTKLPIQIIYNTYRDKFYCIPCSESLSTSGFCMALLLRREVGIWNVRRVWYMKKFSDANIAKILVKPLFPKLLEEFSESAIYDYTLWTISSLTLELSSISLRDKVVMAGHIAEVVGALHRQGYVHRNITSSTISVASDGRCCFSELDRVVSENTRKSITRLSEESYLSLSAKSLQGSAGHTLSIDELKEEDVFALGCVFYVLLTQSSLPWDEEDVVPLTSFFAYIYKGKKKADPMYMNVIKNLLRLDRKKPAEAAKKKLEDMVVTDGSFRDLVYWMLHPEGARRPKIAEVEKYLQLLSKYLKTEAE